MSKFNMKMNAYLLLTRAKHRSHSNHVANYLNELRNELRNELCKRIECLETTENSPAHKYTITKKNNKKRHTHYTEVHI